MLTSFEKCMEAINNGEYPDHPLIQLDEAFVNENGCIRNLALRPVTSVAVILSVEGAIRANHYHKTDWHLSYVLSGKVIYYERSVGDTNIPKPYIFKQGQMFFTPPMAEHAMVFDEETIIITMAKNVRSHESHESDVVRVRFIEHGHSVDPG